ICNRRPVADLATPGRTRGPADCKAAIQQLENLRCVTAPVTALSRRPSMSPDMPTPPRKELEVRLTALLLGELPADEAAALRQAMEQDVELANLYQRLKQTIDSVREIAASPEEQTAAQPAPMKLSDERRQKLLAQFKGIVLKERTAAPRIETWLVP